MEPNTDMSLAALQVEHKSLVQFISQEQAGMWDIWPLWRGSL